MKKLMIALSAVTLAMGVNADVIKGTNLNDGDVSGFTGLGDESQISETPFVASSGENVTDYKSDPAEKNLAIKTKLDAPAYYTLDAAASMDGTFFDSMVKFTYCDEDATVPTGSDAKLMVWVKETEAEGATAGKTNLMITAGYFSTTSGLIEKIYDCGPISNYGITGADDWARLTIKSIPDITAAEDGFPGFNVYVNTQLAQIKVDKAIGDEGSRADSLTRVANEMKKGDYLFPSMIQDQDAQLRGVGFAGQGAIDNIAFTDTTLTDKEGLPFTADPIPAIATVNGQDCGDVAAINNAISTAAEGADVILVYNVEDGDLTFDNGKANTLELGGFTLDGGITVKSGSLTISGTGKVTGAVNGTATTTINGGTFDGKVSAGRGGTLLINDGLFSTTENTKAELDPCIKSGFEAKDNEAGYFAIVAKTYFSGGTGTEADPYIMGKAADLTELKELVAGGETYAGKFFKQTADLDLAGEVWEGIGTPKTTNAFCGTYDGNGQTIKNVTFAQSEYNGLFANVAGATIKNLTVEVVGIENADPEKDVVNEGEGGDKSYGAAAIVGFSNGVTIEGCTAKGADTNTVLRGTHNIGGIGCRLEGEVLIKNCTNELALYTTYSKIAGFCAIASSATKIDGAYCTGDITFDGCVNLADIQGEALQTNSTTQGKTKGGSDGVVGIIAYIQGYADADSSKTKKTLTIKNCENSGTMTGGCPAAFIGKVDGGVDASATGNKVLIGEISGNVVDEDTIACGTQAANIDGLCYAKDGAYVANNALEADNTYLVTAKSMTPAIALDTDETITFDQTLATITDTGIVAKDTENDEIVKNGNTYTCQAIPTATVSITKTNADATISVDDGAKVKRDTVITVTGVTPAAGYKDAKVTINGVEQDTYTVTGDEETIAIVVSATAIPVTGIELDITSTNVAPNDVFTLTATVLPADTLDKTVKWSVVDDSDVVTITPNGATCEVMAAKAGSATVKAVAGDFEATCSVTVAAPGPDWPSDWPDADQGVKDKFAAWKDTYKVDTFEGNEAAFLLNVDPQGTIPELKIESITVANDVATIVVSAGTADLEKVNGILYVDAANDLTDWTTTEVDLAKDAEFAEGKATFTVSAGKFMKAGVGFKAPEAPVTE